MLHFICFVVFFIILWIIFSVITDDVMFGLIIMIIALCILSVSADESMSKAEIDDTYIIKDIYTLEDNNFNNQDGSVVGAFGFVYGKTTTSKGLDYITMVGSDKDGYLVESFDASKTYLYMDGGESPYVKYIYMNIEIKSNWFSKLFFMYDDLRSKLYRVELHIPKEAVSINYNIDLE